MKKSIKATDFFFFFLPLATIVIYRNLNVFSPVIFKKKFFASFNRRNLWINKANNSSNLFVVILKNSEHPYKSHIRDAPCKGGLMQSTSTWVTVTSTLTKIVHFEIFVERGSYIYYLSYFIIISCCFHGAKQTYMSCSDYGANEFHTSWDLGTVS